MTVEGEAAMVEVSGVSVLGPRNGSVGFLCSRFGMRELDGVRGSNRIRIGEREIKMVD